MRSRYHPWRQPHFRRGRRGVKLGVSHARRGINAAVAKVLDVSWQSCRAHFMRNALAHAGKSGRRVVSAFIATVFAQDDAETVRAQWRHIADQLRPMLPKLAALEPPRRRRGKRQGASPKRPAT